jgi:hypothetical protein
MGLGKEERVLECEKGYLICLLQQLALLGGETGTKVHNKRKDRKEKQFYWNHEEIPEEVKDKLVVFYRDKEGKPRSYITKEVLEAFKNL